MTAPPAAVVVADPSEPLRLIGEPPEDVRELEASLRVLAEA
jgi:hypothetical protein